jgi:hypothetical protein
MKILVSILFIYDIILTYTFYTIHSYYYVSLSNTMNP